MASSHTARIPIRALASTGSGFEFLPPLRMHRDSHPASKSSAPGLLLLRVFGIVPSPPSSSGTGLMISMLQLVVEVLADGGQHDLHLAAGRLPAPGAKLDGARARLVALAADAQAAGTGDREVRDHAGTAERPRRRKAELARGHPGLDAFADMKGVAGLIELHGGAVHDPEHAAGDLCAFGGECHPLNCRHCVVVDTAKDRDQRRHPDGSAGVFVAPRTARVIA